MWRKWKLFLKRQAKLVETISAPRSGFISGINARVVGEMAVMLGAGRAKKGDSVNRAVGFDIHCNVGDELEEGDPLFTIHADDEAVLKEARQLILDAHSWSDESVEPLPLFYGVVKQLFVR